MSHDDLSMDARVLIMGWFAWGARTSVTIGGKGAENVLSDRAAVAMDELVAKGYVLAEEYNRFGRMKYTGTEKCVGLRMSQGEMERHGKWSATKPNPEAKRDV